MLSPPKKVKWNDIVLPKEVSDETNCLHAILEVIDKPWMYFIDLEGLLSWANFQK